MENHSSNSKQLLSTQKDTYYSLRSIIADFYVDDMIVRENRARKKQFKNNPISKELNLLSVEKLKGKNFNEQLSFLEANCTSMDKLPNFEDYAKTKTDLLINLLDIFFINSKEKLCDSTKRYKFDEENYLFINVLLYKSMYKKQIEFLRKNNLKAIDPDFLTLLFHSIQSLLDNPHNSLTIQDVKPYFRMHFSKEYIDLTEYLNSISASLQFYYSSWEQNPDIDKIKKMLHNCDKELHDLCVRNLKCSDVDLPDEIIKSLNLQKYINKTEKHNVNQKS